DAQKGTNYAFSSLFERLGQQIRTPVMGYVGQFKTQRQAWMDAATKPVAFLEVDPLAIGDHPAPFPARADFDPRIDQTVLATSVIKDATRGTMGINTSILGQDTGKAKSGVAIKELGKEGEEMIQTFIDLMDPQMRQKAIPVALRLSDKFGAHELADAMDPPQKKFNAQQAAAQMQQLSQLTQMLTKEVHALSEERESKTL